MTPRSVLLIGVLVTACAIAPATAATAAKPAAPTKRSAWTARPVQDTKATTRPGGGRLVQSVPLEAPYWGGANVMLVRGVAKKNGATYVRVLLKRRPSGSTGWIAATDVTLRRTTKRVVIDVSARTVTLYGKGHRVARVRAVVGRHAAPTPIGLFAVDAPVRQPSGSVLGPLVLAVTAYSDTLESFAGGIPQLGIHSYERLGDPLGTASSHGCIRIPTKTVRQLVATVPRGASVLVQR